VPATTDRQCADAVLSDWAENGQVDGRFETGCLLAAIDALPEDLRAYSSAADDISRALFLAEPSGGRETTEDVPSSASGLRRPPGTLLVVVGTGVVVAGAGLAASLARAVRRRA